jgi:hypothetical protein
MNGTLNLAGYDGIVDRNMAYAGKLRVGSECRLVKLCKRARDLRKSKGAKGF